jgi:hypothetical protein
MKIENLNKLQEGKTYIISFDINEYTTSKKFILLETKVLIKLENSIKLSIKNEVVWYSVDTLVKILDEIPAKYLRKEKLENLNNI